MQVRARRGRGTRRFIDRRLPLKSSTPSLKRSFAVFDDQSGKLDSIPAHLRFDQDYLLEIGVTRYNYDVFDDDWRPDVVKKRCKLMTDVDMKELLFKPRQPVLPPDPPVPIIEWVYPTPSIPSSVPISNAPHVGSAGANGHHSNRPPPSAVVTNHQMAAIASGQQQAAALASAAATSRNRGVNLSYGRGGATRPGNRGGRSSAVGMSGVTNSGVNAMPQGTVGASNPLMLTPSNMVGAAGTFAMNAAQNSITGAGYGMSQNRLMNGNGLTGKRFNPQHTPVLANGPGGTMAMANGQALSKNAQVQRMLMEMLAMKGSAAATPPAASRPSAG